MRLGGVSFVRVPWAHVLREPFQKHSRPAPFGLVMTRAMALRVLANAPLHLRVQGTNNAADPCGRRGSTNGCPGARMDPASSCTHRTQARQGLFARSPKQLPAA